MRRPASNTAHGDQPPADRAPALRARGRDQPPADRAPALRGRGRDPGSGAGARAAHAEAGAFFGETEGAAPAVYGRGNDNNSGIQIGVLGKVKMNGVRVVHCAITIEKASLDVQKHTN